MQRVEEHRAWHVSPREAASVRKVIQGLEALLLWCHGSPSSGPSGSPPPGSLLFSWGLHLSIWELGLVPALLPY